MEQTYTSAATSINAAKLPKVYGKITPARRSLLLDYGCGRYTEHIRAALPGVIYLPYDPYNQAGDVNARSLQYVAAAMRARLPVTVVCSNVLNVIDSDDAVQAIADRITRIVAATGGQAYITAYQGDRSRTGRQTGPDQYQRNEPLRDYLRFFPVRRFPTKHGTVIVTGAAVQRGMIVITSEEVPA